MHAFRKVLHDTEIDIRLQQGDLDLPKRLFYVRFRESALAAQLLEHILQFIG